MLHRQNDALRRNAHALRRGVDDAHVGLVRHEPVDVAALQTVVLERLAADVIQCAHRETKDCLAVHVHERAALDRATMQRARHAQDVAVLAVGMQVRRQDAGRRRPFQHHGARAVTEQHAGAPVAPVEQPREHLRADHQGAAVLAARDEPVRDRERIDETRAHGLHVERRAEADAELVLQDAGRGREHDVRRGRRNDDEVDVVGRHAGRRHRLPRRVHRQVGRHLLVRGHATRPDAGAREDPLVGGVDPLLDVLVGELADGQIAARADDPRVVRCSPARCGGHHVSFPRLRRRRAG